MFCTLKISSGVIDQIMNPELMDRGMRLAGKFDLADFTCSIDKIVQNEDEEKRLRIETSAPLKWRFGVGVESPNHKNVLTK